MQLLSVQMKVIHTGTFDVNAGGPAMSTYYTLLGLRRLGVETHLYTQPLSPTGKFIGNEVPMFLSKAPVEHKFLYTPDFKNMLSAVGEFDIYHAQGVWQYPTYALADVARKLNKPYLITPRGMLYPQDIAKSNAFFKKLSLKIRLLNDLNRAACVHVTCEEEMRVCRELGVTAPIAIIPNPADIKEYKCEKSDNIFRLGYLGRISPRKNIQALIYAFAELDKEAENAELLIIGGGDEVYEKFLKSETARLKLKNVRFAGFLSGKEKDAAIASCDVLAMPSEFENLGNVILEGLVRKIPCIATKGAPWSELNTFNCGWWVDFSQMAITDAVRKAINTPREELVKMGENGRKLMERNYSIEAIATKMKMLYEWITGNGNTPDFVYKLPK